MLLNFKSLIDKYNLKINGVIHIGAHYGEEHETYKMNNIKNIIYFEPLKKNYEVLKNNVSDEAEIFNIALGNERKHIEMFVEEANNGQSSSLLEPIIHLEQYPHIIFNMREVVFMDLLDNIKFNRNNFNLINIDVQGYELEVFKGAISTLSTVNYIISEVNRAEVYKNCAKIEELDNFLKEYGFERKEIIWAGGTWGDAFYIKK